MKRSLFIFLSFFLITMTGCGGNDQTKLTLSGTLELTEHSLGAKASGRLVSLNVQEGSLVKKGQEIGYLDRFEQTQKDLDRTQKLYQQGGATQQDVEYATLAMDDQRIVSPVDGVVLVKVHEVGEVVAAGSPVAVVGDREHLWVRIYVPEGLVNRVKMGQPAELRFDGVKQTFKGHVSFIASQAEFTPRNVQTQEERVTQAFAVKVSLDDAPDLLRPGVAADVTINLR